MWKEGSSPVTVKMGKMDKDASESEQNLGIKEAFEMNKEQA